MCYADRSNISTAIIPMAHQFGWDKIREGGVLSAFFYGYALTQLLGGRPADRVGGKHVLLFGVLAWSLATFVTPEAAAAGVAPLLIARVTLGAGEGVAFPAVHALIARHVPKERQTTAVATVTAASYAGAAFAFGVTPRPSSSTVGGRRRSTPSAPPRWCGCRSGSPRDSPWSTTSSWTDPGDARATARAIDDRRPTRRRVLIRASENHPTTNASIGSRSGRV